MSIKQALAVLDNGKDSSMHGYFEVKNSLEAVCLGEKVGPGLRPASTLGRGEITSGADIALFDQDEDAV